MLVLPHPPGNTIKGEHRGRAISLLGGINRITRAVAPMFGGWLSHTMGLPAPFYGRACVAAAAFMVVSAVMPQDAPKNRDAEGSSRKGKIKGHSHLETFRLYSYELSTGGE